MAPRRKKGFKKAIKKKISSGRVGKKKNKSAGKRKKRMSTEVSKERLTDVAEHTLRFFSETAANASEALGEKAPDAGSTFASMNTLTSGRAVQNLATVNQETARDLRTLSVEPAIARIVVTDASGAPRVVYIARGTPSRPPSDGSLVASYRAAMGRIAALPVGSDYSVSRTYDGRILAKAVLHPEVVDRRWDSVDSTVEGLGRKPLTVRSFLALLPSAAAEPEALDLLEKMLQEDRAAANVVEGLRRSVIAKMELRDQPLLDRYQDDIFRLPLSSRLVILGPPGTGKTTTLIKRLGLKLDVPHLNEEELDAVKSSLAGQGGHSASWLMFTPTDLLRQYVKEAFAREGVPASDYRIQTWADHRRELARQKFGILRTAAGTGSFVMKDDLSVVQPTTLATQPAWFADFDAWQAESFWTDQRAHAAALSGSTDPAIARIGVRLAGIVEGTAVATAASAFVAMSDAGDEVQSVMTRLRGQTDAKIRSVVAGEVSRDATVLDRLAEYLTTMGGSFDEGDEQEGEEEDDPPQPRIGREAAFDAFSRAIRAQARAAASGRGLDRQSRSGKIIEWLGRSPLPQEDSRDLGRSIQVQTSARRFLNPDRRYFDGLPLRYRRYRRERQTEGRWYVKEAFVPTEIGPLELDLILLALLKGMRSLLDDRRVGRAVAQGRFSSLRTVRDLSKNQITVDEATDFSPVQLACMASLCDPSTRSFVACGDFNQRITEWGSRSDADLQWLFPDLDIRAVNISYRHSRQLNELARSIALLSDPNAREAQLPERVDNDGVDPVLALNMSGHHQTASWLADRIREIERLTRTLPSIAVLVTCEEDVAPVATALNRALAGENIRVVPCANGNLAGQDNDVRVFDVQHIKGLEFEAVFFVDVDRLAERQPGLFDKFLYVGATRAAMYLGLTTASADLPSRIKSLAGRFRSAWSDVGRS